MKFLFIIILSFSIANSFAQNNIPEQSLQQIKIIELQLKKDADSMIYADSWFVRFKADSSFIKNFVQALKQPYSFWYNFDSVQTISKLYAPDSSFKIFTWEVMKDYTYYRQRGAIQFPTKDGSLKLIPLFDFSDFTKKPYDSIRNAQHWIGSIYYKIILKTYNNKNYYTLLGLDNNDARSTKKWIEVLSFDNEGKPQFGGKFVYPSSDATKPPQGAARFCLEFKKDAGARMNYDARYDAIIFDHLTSESDDIKSKHTLVPYGDYEGFKWINGTWTFIKNPFAGTVFDDKQTDFPSLILDANGNRIEKKLDDASKKNQQKQQQPVKQNDNPNRINDKKNQYKTGESSNS
ncbi:MAG: hypothetical protein JST94_03290 [Bacteroidetes bacterium]|nr:hypothetical protein [Bacteroidota bacterium]MBS1670462.1 hypothetical protein [Bacteroidota bacterium]